MTNKINRPNIGEILFVNKVTWDDMKDIQHCFKILEEFEKIRRGNQKKD
jgi:hypothetical protein